MNINEAYAAIVDAIIADNGLSRSAAIDVLQTFADGVNNTEGGDWIDAVAGDYFRLGLISNSNYNQLRAGIITDDTDLAKDKFDALISSINALPETPIVAEGIRLKDLRADRDEVDTSITTLQDFRTGQTQQVKDALNAGIELLKIEKERLREEIRIITGDPDS